MVKKIYLKVLFYGLLIINWITFDFLFEVITETYVFLAVFLLSAGAIFLIKKEWIKLSAVFALTVGASIYSIDYLTMVFPVVSLLFVLSNGILYSRSKDKYYYNNMKTYVTFSSAIIAFQAVYVIFTAAASEAYIRIYVFENSKTALIFITIFLILIFQTKRENNKENSAYRLLYIEGIIEAALIAVNYSFQEKYANIQSSRVDLLFIFLFVLIMFACDEPYVVMTVKNIEKKKEKLCTDT